MDHRSETPDTSKTSSTQPPVPAGNTREPAGAESSTGQTPLRVKPFSGAAAGAPAVINALKFAMNEMGVVRSAQTLLRVNQEHGFDCPGCAWPDPEHRSTVEFCENGAKAVAAEATLKRVDRSFFARHSISELLHKSDHWLESQGRLTEPMVKEQGASYYTPITWENAFNRIAQHLNKLKSPDEALFYTSGRTGNEAAFLYQLFVRQFGTNNLPDCSNMCHESSGVGLHESIGVGKGTVSLDDFQEADLIFILGQNPGTNHPRMLLTLQAAARKGCTIVSINPLKEAALVSFANPQEVRGMLGMGTPLTEQYLQVKVNGDVALLKGIAKEVLIAEDNAPGQVLDHDFIRTHTLGIEEYLRDIRQTSWEEIESSSGISRAQIQEVAQRYCRANRVIACWAMGLTQHVNGVANIQELVNLLLLRGNLGRKGAGVCPVRGHSNVQGDRTMGINERPSEAFLDQLENTFHFTAPRHHGMSVVQAISAMANTQAKVFIALGGNFQSATPDTEATNVALRRCQLTVQISTKLNRSHLITGEEALILPCLGRTEQDLQGTGPQFVTTENSMGVVQPSRGRLTPASQHLRSEVAIVSGMARATLGNRSSVDWIGLTENYARIRDLIAQIIPGFEQFNERLEQDGKITLPNAARERDFQTMTGKANFISHAIPRHAIEPDQLIMMTIRSHDQYNTTVYNLDDRYRGIFRERRIILMNERDLSNRGLVDGQSVDITSYHEGVERKASDFIAVRYDIPIGCTATYFPEANVLVPLDSYAEKSFTPASKRVVIRVSPHLAP